MKEIYCKTALTNSKVPGIDYSLNPYIGCQHACIYCYVPSLLHIDREEWKNVKVKKNLPNILMKELKKKSKGIVGLSTSTDAYQPIEKIYEITKKCLKLLLKHNWPIDILTKSKLVERDLSLIKKFERAKVGVTITTLKEEKWEGGAKPMERLKTIKKFANNNIHSYIFFGPIFPLINEKEIEYCIEEFISAGVNEIILDKLHVKKGIMEEIKKAYPQQYQEIKKAIYGDFYSKTFKKIKEYAKNKIIVIEAW